SSLRHLVQKFFHRSRRPRIRRTRIAHRQKSDRQVQPKKSQPQRSRTRFLDLHRRPPHFAFHLATLSFHRRGTIHRALLYFAACPIRRFCVSAFLSVLSFRRSRGPACCKQAPAAAFLFLRSRPATQRFG